MNHTTITSIIFAVLLAVLAVLPATPAPAQVTVSGISSGGFMAEQLAVSSSRRIRGVATVAGGVYFCAQNHFQDRLSQYGENALLSAFPSIGGISLTWINPAYRAIEICMHNPRFAHRRELFSSKEMRLDFLTDLEAAGEIDPLEFYKTQRSFIIHGIADSVIQPSMAEQIAAFKRALGVASKQIEVLIGKGGHTFPTDRKDGRSCGEERAPYIGNCGENAAGKILDFLYNEQLTRGTANDTARALYTIATDWPGRPESMADYAYVATSPYCLANADQCRVHVALHGCKMSDAYDEAFQTNYEKSLRTSLPFPKVDLSQRKIGLGLRTFAALSGYLDYAAVESNRLIVLFPQTWITEKNFPFNPKGCWDWFGWQDRNYAKKSGQEMRFINRLIDKVGSDLPNMVKERIEFEPRGL